MKWNISLIQMDVQIGEPEANFTKVRRLMDEAVSRNKPDVIVLPELWNTGYALDRINELADPNGERTIHEMSAFAKSHQVNIVAGSVAEIRGNEVRNTSFIFDREGELKQQYSKIHLFRLMDEEKHLTAGESRSEFQLEHIQCGSMICYDIRFPELARKLALHGAKVLFVPAEWPHPRLHHWRSLLIARAIENQLYVVGCNRAGTSGTTHFCGHSMVIDPWGEVIVEAGEEELILHVEIDLALVDEVRGRIPIFEDRRPNLY